MSGLVLKLRPRERIMINGVVIENGERRSALNVITPDANVLRLRDAIHPKDANTPVKRVVYIAQLVLAGETDPEEARKQLLVGIEQLSQVFTDRESQMQLEGAVQNILSARFYQALRQLRSLMPREKALFELASS